MIETIQDYENWRDSMHDLPQPDPEPDEAIRLTYTHDSPNDTVLEYSRSGEQASLRLSFTSEDPDMGTEELLYNGDHAESLHELISDLKAEIKAYLDYRDTDSFAMQQGMADEIHSMEDMYGEYSRTALYAYEGMLQHYEAYMKADPSLTVPWHAIEVDKTDALYTNYHREDLEKSCIGHLRGDFGRNGEEFWTSWFDHQPKLKTKEFRDELQTVVNALRKSRGLLSNFSYMRSICNKANETDGVYGFRAESAKHEYCLRCIPNRGDYNFYLYCYDKAVLREHEKPSLRAELNAAGPVKTNKRKEKEPER